jgi:hypothetical protein
VPGPGSSTPATISRRSGARLRQGERGGLLPLRLGRGHFPFLPCRRDVRITRLALFFEADDLGCVARHVGLWLA